MCSVLFDKNNQISSVFEHKLLVDVPLMSHNFKILLEKFADNKNTNILYFNLLCLLQFNT